MRKILIIDDDSSFRTAMRLTLQSAGYTTAESSDCQEGIQTATRLMPDIIVSDVEMADGSGFEVLETLRQNPATSTIPFIFVTGDSDPGGSSRSMERGADAYLTKPFQPHSLLATIEARLRKQEALRARSEQTERRLKALVETTPNLVGMAEWSTLQLSYLNRAGREMLGLDWREDVSNITLPSFHSPEVREEFIAQALPLLEKAGRWVGEILLISGHGKEIPVSESIVAHKADDGSIDFLSIVANDLTERKRSEEERRRIESELRHAQKLESIGQLAAGIAHEINTPTQFIGDNLRFTRDAFADIAGVLELFAKLHDHARALSPGDVLVKSIDEAMEQVGLAGLVAEIPTAVEQSLTGVERVAKIVQAMKEFSHPGSENKTPIDLNQAIESTLTVCRNEWKYVAEMNTEFDPALPPVVCHPGEINQVILNIVVNAAHAITDHLGKDAKGVISVRTLRRGDLAEIQINDTGGGIPEAIQNRIFDPFFTTKEVGRGTGQGLAIARSVIVDRHGGELAFQTTPGKGTTFIIRLPINPNNRP